MAVKQCIAVMGGETDKGRALLRQLARHPYRLLVFRHNQERDELLEDLHPAPVEAEVEIVGCAFEAAWEADLILLAVRSEDELQLAGKIREVANRKVVISLSNPMVRSDSFRSAAEALQLQLPGSRVVKAFNTLKTAELEAPSGQPTYLAGDDPDAIARVAQIASSIGLEPILTGGLYHSRALERWGAQPHTQPQGNELFTLIQS